MPRANDETFTSVPPFSSLLVHTNYKYQETTLTANDSRTSGAKVQRDVPLRKTSLKLLNVTRQKSARERVLSARETRFFRFSQVRKMRRFPERTRGRSFSRFTSLGNVSILRGTVAIYFFFEIAVLPV